MDAERIHELKEFVAAALKNVAPISREHFILDALTELLGEVERKDAKLARARDALSGLLRCEYDGRGLKDCIDNTGQHYPSADLAKQIENTERVLSEIEES